jgi:PAS domain S-box-containing protein
MATAVSSYTGEFRLREVDVLAQVDDAIVATDVRGSVLLWNSAAERIYGYSASEMLGRDTSLVFFPEDVHLLDDEVLRPLGIAGNHQTTLRIRRKDGKEIFVSLRLSLLHDDHGSLIGFLGCSNDITEKRKVAQCEDARFCMLTARQREVMRLVALGYATKEIAYRMNVSPKTVEFHKYELMRRLDVHSTAGLTAVAMKHCLVAV